MILKSKSEKKSILKVFWLVSQLMLKIYQLSSTFHLESAFQTLTYCYLLKDLC